MYNCFIFYTTKVHHKRPSEKSDNIRNRQGFAPPIGIPFAAAALPAAAEASIGLYGTYQDEIHRFLDSFTGRTFRFSLNCMRVPCLFKPKSISFDSLKI